MPFSASLVRNTFLASAFKHSGAITDPTEPAPNTHIFIHAPKRHGNLKLLKNKNQKILASLNL